MSHPLTILHIEASMGWGGQEMRILRECLGLMERGHRLFLACDCHSGLFLEALKYNVPLFPLSFSYKKAFQNLRELRRIIRENNIDLLHTHSSVDSWLGGIAARLCGIKSVRTRHLSTPIKGGLNAKILYGWLADAVICTSDSAKSQILEHLPHHPSVSCIATGVDSAKLAREKQERAYARERLGIKKGQVAVGMACVLRSWKGIEEFIQAADLLKNHSELKFFVFGGGQGLAHYKKVAKSYPGAQVTFTGHIDPIGPSIAALDIFCLLSTNHEGISQATLQAAFLKKPLVTTDVGGLTAVCQHEKTGLIVEKKNPAAVAKAIERLSMDSLLCEQLGKAGHRLVLEKFTMEKSLDAIETVLRGVVSSHKA